MGCGQTSWRRQWAKEGDVELSLWTAEDCQEVSPQVRGWGVQGITLRLQVYSKVVQTCVVEGSRVAEFSTKEGTSSI